MKIRKKLLWYLAVLGLSFAVVSPVLINNNVYAADDTTATSSETKKKESDRKDSAWKFIDLILNLMYVVLRPMLFIAGIALDNSMVYGSVFNMDAPLRMFWNMTKNFANFILGFLVLFSILKWIFSSFGGDKQDKRSPMNVIKKTLIAGVLIQASWFLTAALIDISTIATYSIGWMPASLLSSHTKEDKEKLLTRHSKFNLNDQSETFNIMSRPTANIEGQEEKIDISPCLVKTLWYKSYIVWRKYSLLRNEDDIFDHRGKQYLNYDKTAVRNPHRNICALWNTIYFFNEFPNAIAKPGWTDYSTILHNNININSWAAEELTNCGFLIDVRSSESRHYINIKNCDENRLKTALWVEANDDSEENKKREEEFNEIFGNLVWTDLKSERIWLDYPQKDEAKSRLFNTKNPTIGEIIDKAKWFMWPLSTIFISIMDFANLTTASQDAVLMTWLWEMLIRLWVWVGLIFPLIALAVVLFIRIWFLWMVIWASPLIVLANVFKDTFKLDKFMDKVSLSNIIKVAFAPVITVFALSISMVFMNTLATSFSSEDMTKLQPLYQFWIENADIENADTEYVYKTIFWYTIAYPKTLDTHAGATGDFFSWLIVSFFGVWIMRFVLFAAIKASGTVWAAGEKIKEFGENVFKTAPIIPFGDSRVGAWTLGKAVSKGEYAEKFRDNRVVKYNDQTRAIEGKFWAITGASPQWNISESQKATLSGLLNTGRYSDAKNRLVTNKFVWSTDKSDIQGRYQTDSTFATMIDSRSVEEKLKISEKFFGDDEFLTKEQKTKITENLKWAKSEEELEEKIEELNANKDKTKPIDDNFEIEIGDDVKTKYTVTIQNWELKAEPSTP